MLLKKMHETKEPADGDYKITMHFAWLPVRTGDGIIWMEKYKKIWYYSIKPRIINLHFTIKIVTSGAWDLMEVKRAQQ